MATNSIEIKPEQFVNQLTPVKIDLLVVIVCYKVPDLTIDCLETLVPELRQLGAAKVVVCENGTGPESVRQLQEAIERNGWSDVVMLKALEHNRGFTGGNNAVLDEVLSWLEPPRYCLLLNADTLVRPGGLRTLLQAGESDPTAGVISPRLEWPDGTGQGSCFYDHSPLHEFITAASTGPISRTFRRGHGTVPLQNDGCYVEWTSFACALIRREVFYDTGGLDPGYFLYYDDPDFCRRARSCGWRVLHQPDARVVHLRGRSNPVKTQSAQRSRRSRYWYESRARYYAKFYGLPGLWAANILWTLGRVISLTRELVGRKEPHTCKREWLDIWTNSVRPFRKSESSESR
jgi:GT2 family glycosyltransferase